MDLILETQPLPLHLDPSGVVRVGDTRVTLDTLIATFNQGATAEEIVFQYPSLSLPEVYAALSYYLQHQRNVDLYLHQRQIAATEIRHENESKFPPVGVRARLLARKQE